MEDNGADSGLLEEANTAIAIIAGAIYEADTVTVRDHLPDEQRDAFVEGFGSIRQVLADMEYNGANSGLLEEANAAIVIIGDTIYESGIPETPQPRRDGFEM